MNKRQTVQKLLDLMVFNCLQTKKVSLFCNIQESKLNVWTYILSWPLSSGTGVSWPPRRQNRSLAEWSAPTPPSGGTDGDTETWPGCYRPHPHLEDRGSYLKDGGSTPSSHWKSHRSCLNVKPQFCTHVSRCGSRTFVGSEEFLDGFQWSWRVLGDFRTSPVHFGAQGFRHFFNLVVVCWYPHAEKKKKVSSLLVGQVTHHVQKP